jgi:apolipoprotein D and lipocalin family protein
MQALFLAAVLCLSAPTAFAADAVRDAAGQAESQALATIATLDVPRYMGTWYEIARYPNWFQKKCAGYVRADYRIEADGRVQVINRCRLDNGEMAEAQGVARQLGGATSAKLEVRFAPAWLSFIPAVWGDYWVIELDEDYRLAVISEPKREYLWILSRTPKLDPASYEKLLLGLARQGFDIRKLELTRQD